MNSSLLVNIYNNKKVFINDELVNDILCRVEKNKLTYNGCILTKEECLNSEVKLFVKILLTILLEV